MAEVITIPGIYTLSMEEYLADPCVEPSLSSHIARELLDASPLHAWTKHPGLNRNARPDPTPAKELGTLAHRIVLEGRPGDVVVIAAPDYRTKAAQTQRDEARAANKIPILEADWIALDSMLIAWTTQFRMHDPVPFVGGVPEQTLLWQEQGTWCRARLDYVTPTEITDFKTTSTTANPHEWARRKLWEGGLELQAAFHQRGLQVLTHLSRRDFRFIVAETEPPYAVSAVSLDPEAWDYAHARRREAVTIWRDCLTSGTWPGYPTRCAFAEVPPWIKARAIEGAYWR